MARWKLNLVILFSILPYRFVKYATRFLLATQGIGFAGRIEESGEAALLRRLSASGVLGDAPTFIDVGAHVGEYVLLIKSFWSEATVYAFEPSASHYRVLAHAVERKHLAKVHTFPVGLSFEEGERTLWKPEEISGLASLERRDIRHIGVTDQMAEQVRTTTLEAVVETQKIAIIDFMKVDIEGHELSCFRGATRLIREGRIRIIQFEYGHAHIASKVSVFDLFECFIPFGYKMGTIKPDGRVLVLNGYDEFLETNLATNYIAVRPELTSAVGVG